MIDTETLVIILMISLFIAVSVPTIISMFIIQPPIYNMCESLFPPEESIEQEKQYQHCIKYPERYRTNNE